jgi:uncharacterized protein YdeI (YjbR/CyaY-like superfamily)
MPPKIHTVTEYLTSGCGRCDKFETPECKVHRWREALEALRTLCLESGLTEEVKWSHPCYTHRGKNVAIVGAFNDFCTLAFFKGALLHDPAGLLETQGENGAGSRIFRVTHAGQIPPAAPTLRAYLQEAILLEETGARAPSRPVSDFAVPEELAEKFAADASYEAAFRALTPGRQKAYLLIFGQAKQAATRRARIEKFEAHVRAGKGPHDGYGS